MNSILQAGEDQNPAEILKNGFAKMVAMDTKLG